MEFSTYIEEYGYIIIVIVIAILFFAFISAFIKNKRDLKLLNTVTSIHRGTNSERRLVLQLLKHGIPAQAIFHDLLIEKDNGVFSQIDVVVATSEGIIVFEVKDYSGWIFGNGNHSQWTQVLSYGKKKYRFYNPIKQNQNHIQYLRNQLEQFKDIPFFSIIVFYGNCVLKDINYIPKETYLVTPPRIFDVLNLIKSSNKPASYKNKREILNMLNDAVLKGQSKVNHEKHINNINDMLGKERIFD